MQRAKEIESVYREELDQLGLAKGSLVIKTIKGKPQPYLQWREGTKTKSQYIKKPDLTEMQKNISRRKELQDAIKRVIADQKKLERILRYGDK